MKSEKNFIKLPLMDDPRHIKEIFVNPEKVEYVRDAGKYYKESDEYDLCIIGINGREFQLDYCAKDAIAALFGLEDNLVITPESQEIQDIM